MIDAVVFDWGGTLTDDLLANLELVDVWQVTARRLDPAREAELADALAAAEVRFWQRTETTQESGTLADLLLDASQAVGLDVTDALLEEVATHHLDTWTPHIRHDKDAAATLAALRESGIHTALLSNTHWPRAFHERFLERDGLASLLEARLYSSELSHMKPHPSVFAAALAAVGVDDPASAVFVGDRLYDDIFGAKRAGLRTVLRPNERVPGYAVEPDAVITALPELLPLVEKWSDD